ESLDLKNDKEERQRMLQNIITNVLKQRSYSETDNASWLLFEMENNLLIHRTQYSFLKMTHDKTNETDIYQLKMGEGKTLVILILLSQMLANGKNITRINCLEPLMGAMQELLKN
ncbi:unnamed protein product, partial [Didymodactylos carnosus]